MNHSTKRSTKAEQDRLDAIHSLPCLACAQEMNKARIKQPFPTEAHHIVDKGYRKHSGGHAATLPLCAWHHRGDCLPGAMATTMAKIFGPSMALQKKSFVERYGGERILLVETDALIAANRHTEFA